ncbi:tRNA (adenosine(37)-N6)-dimethylallyltransferase MiaA [Candidatus Saganbacteria bacterium]|nr:tRNA (adenosine(37)-N6)-dimethylallyltransferase MiaA [Candidatus Saganbacteria bacterium]
MPNINPIILLGQTAVGKTKLSIELAKKINGEIISADSMQVYRGMDIGTAKPATEERQGILHHLIDIRNPNEEWTVSDFVGEVNKLIPPLSFSPLIRGRCPELVEGQRGYIIVGGTGLYLWSLLEGFQFPIVETNKEVREELESIPTPTLYSQLSEIDPAAAEKINRNDKKRIIRALEVFELTGKPISELQKKHPLSFSPLVRGRCPELVEGQRGSSYTIIGLSLPREILYERINKRVDNMIAKGLIDEVKGLLAKGYPKDIRSFQALGYKEVIEYLDGNFTKEQMIEELKKRTRNFARRQMTWFKRFKDVNWIESRENPIDAIKPLTHFF